MIDASFVAFLLMCITATLLDWRRGWLLTIVCGVLQDPVRKLSPGAWVGISLSVVVVYFVVIFAGQSEIEAGIHHLTRRFANLYAAFLFVFFSLLLAAVNGIVTFGMEYWKVPALSLFIYCLPIPAVALGYAYVKHEEQLVGFFRFYAVLTSTTLIGTVLEYYRIPFRALGTVAFVGDNIRMLPGIEIRMLSGFYRAPDVMGWHAATLTCVGVLMALRGRSAAKTWPWMLVIGWGMLNALLSGRRKAVYMIAVFSAVIVWRYLRRLSIRDLLTFVLIAAVLLVVVREISKNEQSSVYARGAETTREEVYSRLEGGTMTTFQQYGLLGAGLGAATQGTQHLTAGGVGFGWQEGGLAKLAIEVGAPGMAAITLLMLALLSLLLKITAHPDIPESSQLMRVGLFALLAADAATFLASAQVYSDPLVVLTTSFTLGTLLAMAVIDERTAETIKPAPAAQPVRA